MTQTWGATESITFNNISIVCYEAAPTITTNAPFCTGSTLTLDGNAADPSSVVSWVWSNDGGGTIANPNAQNTTSANPTNGETYTLVTTDPNGCTGVATETVTVVSSPTASISVNPTSACEGSTFTLTITGTPNADVILDNNGFGNQTITLDNSGTYSQLSTMGNIDLTYTLISVTLGSCTQALSESVMVTLIDSPTATVSVSPMNACEGDLVTFTFTGTPGATVNFTDGAINDNVVLDGSGNASYSVTMGFSDLTLTLLNATLSGCTQSLSGSATVVVSPTPWAAVSPSPTSACTGELVTFTFTGTPNATVTYTNGSGTQFITLDGTGVATVTEVAGTSDFVYNLSEVNIGNCTQTLNFTLIVPVTAAPTASISANPTAACEGDIITFTFSGTPNATVTYNNGSTNTTITLDGAGNASVVLTAGSMDLTYTLISVALNSCSQNLNEFATVTSSSTPTATVTAFPTSVCAGDNITFTFTGTPFATITYDNNIGPTSIVLDAAGNASVVEVAGMSQTIIYTLISATLNGCSQTLTDFALVNIVSSPTASLSTSTTSACAGENIVFTFTGTPFAEVVYNDGFSNLSVFLDASGNATLPIIINNVDLTYSLVSASLGGCSQNLSDVVTVFVSPAPTASIFATPTTACENEPVAFIITGTPNATVTYNDGISDQMIVLDGSGNATISTTAGVSDITYTLVDITLGACTALLSESATITVTQAPWAIVSHATFSSCPGSTVTINFDGTPNATINYEQNGVPGTITLDNNGFATFDVTMGTDPLVHELIDVTINGCTEALTLINTLFPVAPPNAIISVSPMTACEGDLVTFDFNGTPGSTVIFFDGTSNQSLFLGNTGFASTSIIAMTSDITYTLLEVTLGECFQILNIPATVTVTPNPTATISASPLSACQGDEIVFTITGTPDATVTYNDGTNNQSISLDGSGTATIPFTAGSSNTTFTLMDITSGNCTTTITGSATVVVTPEPTATIFVVPTTVCAGALVTFTITGTPNASVTFDDEEGGQTVTLDANGIYQTTIPTSNNDLTYILIDADLNGCGAILNSAATVTITPLPTATISVDPTAACEGDDVIFTISGTPNATITYDVSNGGSGLTIVLDNSGFAIITETTGTDDLIYTLTLAEINNCSQTLNESALVSVSPPPLATVSGSPVSACEGDLATFTITGTPDAIITYNVNGGADQNILLGSNGMATFVTTVGNTDETVTLTNALLGICNNALTSNATITITPLPTANPASLSACNDGTGQGEFDLTSVESTIGTGTIDWFDAALTPIANPANYSSGNATVFATLTINGCTSELVDVNLTLNELPTFTNLTDDCTASNLDYIVEFEVNGGATPYSVTGGPGTFTGNQFTSDPIMVGTAYSFFITDNNGCGPVEVSGNNLQCDCISDAGNMDPTLINICIGQNLNATHLGNELLDGDDLFLFYLHDNAGNTLGNIFATSTTPSFTTIDLNGLSPNTIYYVSAVVGNDDGTGIIDLSDNCLSVSQGTPFIIQEIPEATITADEFICPDDCTTLTVSLTGTPPFDVDYEINHPVNGIQIVTETTSNSSFDIDICADGAVDATINVTLVSLTDNFCFNNDLTESSVITVGNNAATGEELYEGCIGDGYSVVVNNVIYNEANPSGTETIDATSGCDSLVTIDLTFNDVLRDTINYNGCFDDGFSVDVNGTIYDEDNPTGEETLPSSAGCDSIVTVILVFDDAVQTDLTYNGCEGDGYEVIVDGVTYDEGNPTGAATLVSTSGCDSIVTIILVFNEAVTGEESYMGCTGDGYSVSVNGTLYNEGNPTGSETLMSAVSCDSIVSINLQFSNELRDTINYAGCNGDGFEVIVNGIPYNEANPIGEETLQSSAGCDSIVSIILMFDDAIQGTENYSGCEDDGYEVTVNGTVYNQANPTGTETLPSSGGCDSIVTINLVYNEILTGSETYSGCEGDGYAILINGTLYNENNPIGTETLSSSLNCDSIVGINLSYAPSTTGEEIYTGCTGDGYSVTVNGNLYDEANPNGMETIPNANNCDSIISINLIFLEEIRDTINYAGCNDDGFSVMVNGNLYDELNPTGEETLPSSAGCDSIVTIVLVFDDVLNGEETYIGCEGDGYQVPVNGMVYNEANPSGVETLVSSTGCDSLVVINLIFNEPTTGEETHDGCIGDGYEVLVNGTLYNEANPTGTETLVGSNSCDSIVSVLLEYNTSVSGEELYNGCNGDGYEVIVNGTAYNEVNPLGMETLISNGGCDSIVTINLTFNSFLTGEELYTGCENDGYSITINGTIYNEGNPNGTETLPSSIGCDSIVTIDLDFNPILSGTETYNGCEGDGYAVLVNGTVYNEANPTGSETLMATTGCDSIVTVTLVFSDVLTGEENYFGCEGDGYAVSVNGTIYNEANPTGTETLMTATCDSIVMINLFFNAPSSSEFTRDGCTGDGFETFINGTLYNEVNPTGTEILLNSNYLGCDSTVTVNLVFSDVLTGEENYFGCEGDGYAVSVNGTLYNEANPTGTETLMTASCDSVVTINLVFNAPSSGEFTRAGCTGDGFETIINGTLYNEANPTGTEILPNSNYLGCDSTVNVALSFSDEIVNDEFMTTILCQDDFVAVNGTIYDLDNPSGTEIIVGGSAFGCDSVINVNLAFYPTVSASLSAAAFVCPGDSTPITFNLEGGTNYNVAFDNNGTVVNLSNITDGHTIMVAPTTTTTYSILAVAELSIPCNTILPNTSITIDVSNITLTATVDSDFDGFNVSCNDSADGAATAVADNGQAPYQYDWSDGSTGAVQNTLAAGSYQITATDAAGCTAETAILLTAPTAIELTATAEAPSCFGDIDGQLILDTIIGGTGPYEYSIDGFIYESVDTFPFVIPNLASGETQLFIQDINDCSIISNNTIPSAVENIISLGDDQEILLSEDYRLPTFTNFSVDTLIWSTTEYMDCDTCLQPTVTPQFTTAYSIEAIDENGCLVRDEVTITILKPRQVYIPNAFSPNGDGNNDFFTVFSDQAIQQVNYLRVFDRWGELVFQNMNFDPNNPQLGWNGDFKGKGMQPGVYVYVAEVLFVDGLVLLYEGDVTIMK
ncbi:MAG: gliding motility-associated C-terminal domain-containing protein [Saprospiraceae bacterium]